MWLRRDCDNAGVLTLDEEKEEKILSTLQKSNNNTSFYNLKIRNEIKWIS